MGIYKKLQEVRSELTKINLKKTGFNKFSNFKYFELGDFLPSISKLCADKGICSVVNFGTEKATLTLFDDESEQSISIETEVRKLNLISKDGKEKMNDLQALGAEQTYLRRYLYMNMFEVVENDVLDSGEVKTEEKPKEDKPTARDKLISKMIKGYFTEKDILKVLDAYYQEKDINKLTEEQFKDFLIKLERGIESKNNLNKEQKEEPILEVPETDPRLEALQENKSDESYSYDDIDFSSGDII